jgi:hypothetical protein
MNSVVGRLNEDREAYTNKTKISCMVFFIRFFVDEIFQEKDI